MVDARQECQDGTAVWQHAHKQQPRPCVSSRTAVRRHSGQAKSPTLQQDIRCRSVCLLRSRIRDTRLERHSPASCLTCHPYHDDHHSALCMGCMPTHIAMRNAVPQLSLSHLQAFAPLVFEPGQPAMPGLIGDVPHTKRLQHHTLHTSAGQVAIAQAAAQHCATARCQQLMWAIQQQDGRGEGKKGDGSARG